MFFKHFFLSEDISVVVFFFPVPSSSPQNLTAVSTGPHEISLSWSPVSLPGDEAAVLGYDIIWTRLSDDITSQFRSNSLKSTFNITSLQVFAWYQVTVRVYNSLGSGPNSSYISVRTHGKGIMFFCCCCCCYCCYCCYCCLQWRFF